MSALLERLPPPTSRLRTAPRPREASRHPCLQWGLLPGQRVFYANNLMFIDQAKAGMSREVAVKALKAEGVSVSSYKWHLLHDYPIFHEKKWWHHLPAMPGSLPGSGQANRTTIALPYFTSDAPELVDQYVRAFEKVWAHRTELAKA